MIHLAARDFDPSHINRYLLTLAGDFHRFYNACYIRGEAPEVLSARLKLADTVRLVIANGLELIGVSARKNVSEKPENRRLSPFCGDRRHFI